MKRRILGLWKIREVRAFLVILVLKQLADGWFMSTYVLFLQNQGLSLAAVNLVNLVFMLASTLLDPWSGRLADQVGQKKVYVGGVLFWATGMAFYGWGGGVLFFLIGEMTAGVGRALVSEALESWLRNVVDEKTTEATMSLMGAVRLASALTACLGSVVAVKIGMVWPWKLAAIGSLVTAVIAWRLLKPLPEGRNGNGKKPPSVKEVLRLIWKNKDLRLSAMVGFGVAVAVAPFNMFWSPVLRQTSDQLWWLGPMWAGMSVTLAIGSWWAKGKADKSGIVKTVAMIGLPMLIPAIFPSTLPIAVAVILHEVGRGAIRPLLFTYSNRQIEDRYRSTANSVLNSAGTAGMAVGLVVSGLLVLVLLPIQIWFISAMALIIIAILVKVKG